MMLQVNGEQRDLEDVTTVADLVRTLGRDPERPGVAVAVDGDVVPRAAWPDTALSEGANIEVVAAVQGG